jgi:hypothetical protein
MATNPSGASLVVLEQSTQARMADNLLALLQRFVNVVPWPGEESVANALVRSQSVVVIGERRYKKVKMPLAEHDEVAQTLLAKRLAKSQSGGGGNRTRVPQ